MITASFLVTLSFLLRFALLGLFDRPQKPSEDPFYHQPENISDYEEGDIISWRNTPQLIRTVLTPINIEGSWQFMFRTTNSHGDPVGVIGTIIKPYDADPKKVLVYSYFQDSASKDCAPSYSILFNAAVDTIALQSESPMMNIALTKGWNVLVVDYEGLNASFTATQLAGKATLDAILATLSSTEHTAIDKEAKVALWGYSGGTIPLAWAGLLQHLYAPELSENLIGIAIGGWVVDLKLVIEKIDGGLFAGFVGTGLLGLANEYPEVGKEMFDLMKPDKIDKVKKLYNRCLVTSLVTFAFTKFFKGDSAIFPDGIAILDKPAIKAVLDENTFNEKSVLPDVPIFLYHGMADEIVPFEAAEKTYNDWCERKVKSMEFAVAENLGHGLEYLQGAGAAIAWLEARFLGEVEPVEGCNRTERKTNLKYPGADESYFFLLRTSIQGIFQRELGPMLNKGVHMSGLEKEVYKILASMVEFLGRIPVKREYMEDGEDENRLRFLEY